MLLYNLTNLFSNVSMHFMKLFEYHIDPSINENEEDGQISLIDYCIVYSK